ncbi:MAG: transcription antitermination factor NusB [Streptosporangiales bacterium]|nr:transcription antitermination factor NusB [Streptosporangiales bacterium]
MPAQSSGRVGARGKARKRALDLLFEADVRRADPLTLLAERIAASDPVVPEYAVGLVEGVTAHRAQLDELIAKHSVDWSLDRMPAVDRNLLRLGTYELLYADDVPDAVAVAEAVRLARELSTDESPGFVNGLLAAVLSEKGTAAGA